MTKPPHEPFDERDLYAEHADPFSAFSRGPEQPPPPAGATRPIGSYEVPEPIIPVAPHQGSGAGVKIVVVLAVFALSLGALIFWLSTKDTIEFGGGGAPTSTAVVTTAPPTTTSTPAPFAVVGDCVSMTGNAAKPDYRKVACGEHNYTVSKVASSSSEKCGEPADGYVQYVQFSVLASVSVCLIPVFADGQCYDFSLASIQAAVPRKECGTFGVARVKVLANTVDKAACGGNPLLALAYPETRTTYCFTQTS